MTDINPYIALATNGFFTGLGVIAAQHFYEIYVKKKVEKWQKHIAESKEQSKNAL